MGLCLKRVKLLVILSFMCVELSRGRSYQVALGCKRHHKDNCLVDEYCDIMQQVCKPCEGLCREYKDACKQQCPRQYEIQYVRKPTTIEDPQTTVDPRSATELGNIKTPASKSNDENERNMSPLTINTILIVECVAVVVLIVLITLMAWKWKEPNNRRPNPITNSSQALSPSRQDNNTSSGNMNCAASSSFGETQEDTSTV